MEFMDYFSVCNEIVSDRGSSFYCDRSRKVVQYKQMNEPPPESFILHIYKISVNQLQGAQGIAWIGTD